LIQYKYYKNSGCCDSDSWPFFLLAQKIVIITHINILSFNGHAFGGNWITIDVKQSSSVLNKNQDCSSIKISIGIVSFHVETLKWLNCWLLRCVSSRVWRVWRHQTWHLSIPKFLFALRSSAEPLIRVWKS
jgi:hypothetical protein